MNTANGPRDGLRGQGRGLPVPGTVDHFHHKSLLFLAQDTLNNNSLGKKHSWQDRVSRSSSPLKTGKSGPFSLPGPPPALTQSPLQRANPAVSKGLSRGKQPTHIPAQACPGAEISGSMSELTGPREALPWFLCHQAESGGCSNWELGESPCLHDLPALQGSRRRHMNTSA